MKRVLLTVTLTLLTAVQLARAAIEPVVPPDEVNHRIEAALTKLFASPDSITSDMGVVVATLYRRIQTSPKLTPPQRTEKLLKLMKVAEAPVIVGKHKGMAQVPASALPKFFDDGDRQHLTTAVEWALGATRSSRASTLPFGTAKVRKKDLLATLELFRALLDKYPVAADLAAQIPKYFDIYRSPGLPGLGAVLYTCYNDPVYEGTLREDENHHYPVYSEPRHKGISNSRFERSEVAKGALKGHGLEIAWLRHPIDAYLLEVEGSGLIHLPDGKYLKVEFSGKNGRAYKSLGKAVVRAGILKPWEMDMLSIRKYFDQHRDKLQGFLDLNPSVVFFKAEALDTLPASLQYTPQRTLACDQRYFPRGGLAFIALTRPNFPPGGQEPTSWEPFNRFAVDQDTGGAIKGPGHIDIYWGHDEESTLVSAILRDPGILYYLLKKGTSLN